MIQLRKKDLQLLESKSKAIESLDELCTLESRLTPSFYTKKYSNFKNLEQLEWLFDIKKPETQQILFFQILKLKPISVRGKSGRYQTNSEFQQYYIDVPEVKKLDEINKLNKTISTNIEEVYNILTHKKEKEEYESYIKKVSSGRATKTLKEVNPPLEGDEKIRKNRINSSYGFTGVVTGRSSSSNPNFQNISVRSLYSTLIKRQFIAPKGYLFIHSDLNAAEIRALTNLAGDPALKERFFLGQTLRRKLLFEKDPSTIKELEDRIENEGDIHRYHYRMFYNIPPEVPITKDQRQLVKGLVFGLVYGKSASRFAKDLNEDISVGEFLYNKFFEFYPKSTELLYKNEESAAKNLYVKSPVSRYRRLGASLSTDDSAKRAALATQSRNSPVQSFSSDTVYIGHRLFNNLIFKLNHRYGWKLDCRICNTVHDSLEGECKIEHLPMCIYLQSVVYSDFVKKYIKKYFNFEMILPQELEMDVGTGMSEIEGVIWRDFPNQIHKIIINQSTFYNRDEHKSRVDSAVNEAKKKYSNITPKIVDEVVRKSLDPINLNYTEEEISTIERKLKNNYEVINEIWQKESVSFIRDMTIESFLYDSNKLIEVGKKLMF